MPSRAQGLQTRARLLEAAIAAFGERGLADSSLDAVATAAGVTRQGLSHYFPSKFDLLLAVLEQRDAGDAEVASLADADPAVALPAIMDHNLRQAGLTRLFAVSVAEGLRPEHPTHDFFRERYRGLREKLTAGIRARQQDGRISPSHDAEALAVALLALLHGLNLQQLLEPDIDHRAVLDGILSLLNGDGE